MLQLPDVICDIIYDICSFAAADPAPAQRPDANDGGHERDADLDREMDADEERDYADQDPRTLGSSFRYPPSATWSGRQES